MTWTHGQEQAAIATEQQNKRTCLPMAVCPSSEFALCCLPALTVPGVERAQLMVEEGSQKPEEGQGAAEEVPCFTCFFKVPREARMAPKYTKHIHNLVVFHVFLRFPRGSPDGFNLELILVFVSDVSLIFRWKPRCPKNSRNALTYSHFARGRGCS